MNQSYLLVSQWLTICMQFIVLEEDVERVSLGQGESFPNQILKLLESKVSWNQKSKTIKVNFTSIYLRNLVLMCKTEALGCIAYLV